MSRLAPSLRSAGTVLGVLSAMALVVLDAGVANVALPTIGRALDVTPSKSVLVITAYQAGLVMALLPCGALGERFGFRRVFTVGVATFAAASVFCAAAPSLDWLVAARLVQGIGGAAVMALGVALLRLAVPSGRLGEAIGWNALTVAIASAAAPGLGAIILSQASWPWIFAAPLPLAIMALAATRAMPASPGANAPLDPISMALNAGMFALLILSAEIGAGAPLFAATSFVFAATCLAVLVRREGEKHAPMFPLDLLRAKPFRMSVFASVSCFTAQSAGLLALPFYLQHELQLTPLMTGLYLTPWPMSVAATAVVAGRLSDRVSTSTLCVIGGFGLSVGLMGAAVSALLHQPPALVASIVLCGFGFGLFQTPNNRNMFMSAPPERSGAAGGMQGTARVTGQITGALMMTLLFSLSVVDAPKVGLALAASFALAAGLLSFHPATSPK
ncbi:MAG: MFS transporter [Phenylobacterium sp.]|uniref:MFS transporter n=1 Tax=Phenylobacterium sp. TaxID=1871053 RepID=UPI002715D77F|nr:MFS transporter [Phenylobacterium sp.]MDO9431275.1 MFS transporter [Phenylobacterium sp.]